MTPRSPELMTCALLLALVAALACGCLQSTISPPPAAPSPAATPAIPSPTIHPAVTVPIRSSYSPGEVTRLYAEAEQEANASFNAIAAIPPGERTFDNTLLAYDRAFSAYEHAIGPLLLMGYVYPDPGITAEGMVCDEATGVFFTTTCTRRDLYEALKAAIPRTADESRLYNVTICGFEQNGLSLPEDRLARVRSMNMNLSRLQTEFLENLNGDNTTLVFTQKELAGVPEESLATFRRTPDGACLLTMNPSVYQVVMRTADRAATRKAMYAAYNEVQAEENTRLLDEMIGARRMLAQELGYDTWADYRLDGRMAGNRANVFAFLDAVRTPLQEKNRVEMADLLRIKQARDPGATAVDPWDVVYLQEEQKRLTYAYDEEEAREYFPAGVVVPGMLSTFGTVLGVRFEEVAGVPAWSPDVLMYRVANLTDNATIGYLYYDLYPREYKQQYTTMRGITGGRLTSGTVKIPPGNDTSAGGLNGTASDNGTDSPAVPDARTVNRTGSGPDNLSGNRTGSGTGLIPGTGADPGNGLGYGTNSDTGTAPVAVIICNLAPPRDGKPSLMTTYEVWVLFHETGHAMHHLLSRAPYHTLSGLRVEWDFIETPSQAFEEWFYDPEVMESVSGHYTNTSQKIPPSLRNRIIGARNAGNGYFFSRQLVFALLDMRIHSTAEGPVNVTGTYLDTFSEVMGSPPGAGYHMPARFQHLVQGYDAGYYGYFWSKVYALEILSEFQREGMTDPATGMRFRQEVLEQGNMEDGMVLLERFFGRQPRIEGLYAHIGINVTDGAG